MLPCSNCWASSEDGLHARRPVPHHAARAPRRPPTQHQRLSPPIPLTLVARTTGPVPRPLQRHGALLWPHRLQLPHLHQPRHVAAGLCIAQPRGRRHTLPQRARDRRGAAACARSACASFHPRLHDEPALLRLLHPKAHHAPTPQPSCHSRITHFNAPPCSRLPVHGHSQLGQGREHGDAQRHWQQRAQRRRLQRCGCERRRARGGPARALAVPVGQGGAAGCRGGSHQGAAGGGWRVAVGVVGAGCSAACMRGSCRRWAAPGVVLGALVFQGWVVPALAGHGLLGAAPLRRRRLNTRRAAGRAGRAGCRSGRAARRFRRSRSCWPRCAAGPAWRGGATAWTARRAPAWTALAAPWSPPGCSAAG